MNELPDLRPPASVPLSCGRRPHDLEGPGGVRPAISLRALMPVERHIWIIDSIEEDVAAVEEDGERLRHVARWLLPAEVREGTVLSVTRDVGADGAISVLVAIERASQDDKRTEARERPRNASDRGGDIVL